MKIKSGFLLREVAGSYVVVTVGERVKEFNGMVNLNETGAYLWKILEKGADEQELLKALLKEYDVDEQTAKTDVKAFIKKLNDNGLVE